MMRGQVVGLQAHIGVVFRLPGGLPNVEIEFVVDTGFEGALTLPPAAVAALKLPFLQEMNANLANNKTVKTEVYVATILWDGSERDVAVLAMGQRPLLGTALLAQKPLGVDFTDGGTVAVSEL